MMASDHPDFIDYARKLSQQEREPLPYYEHSEIGYNYRMRNILAAIGRAQLDVLDQRVKRKREIFNTYSEALSGIPGIEFMPESSYGSSNRFPLMPYRLESIMMLENCWHYRLLIQEI